MSREMLRRLARRELAPGEISELLRHIGECAACARDASVDAESGLEALQATLEEDEGPWHLDPSELTAYVDGVAAPAEREIVESHLADCATCRVDVADLEALRRRRPRRRSWRVAVTVAAAASVAAVVVLRRSNDAPPPAPPPAVIATQPPVTATADAGTTPHPPARYARPEWERLVRTAVTTATLPFPPELEISADALRGTAGEAASAVWPAGVAVNETRPQFAWPERKGATYVVSVFAGEEQVAQSEPLTATRWTPPAPLARGRTYVWQVRATGNGTSEIIPAPPAPAATFRIVSGSEHDELAAARRAHPDDHVLHAVLAARAGLRAEALESLRRARQSATQQNSRLIERYVTARRR